MHPITPSPVLPLALALTAGLPAAAAAGEGSDAAVSQPGPAAIQEALRGIRGMQRLPVSGVQMVEAGGRVLFLSANGRYVFTGPAWDLWHGAQLGTLDEAARLAGRIDLKRLGLDPAALGAIDVGAGAAEVVIFVDPLCPHCRRLLAALPNLAATYRFRLVPLPVLGPDSEAAVARLACLAQQDGTAARERILSGDPGALPVPEEGCGQAPAQRALVAAQLLGLSAVPTLIAPDGRLTQGVPEDLVAWLENAQ